MPQAWRSFAKAQKQPAYGKGFTRAERTAIFQLAASLPPLRIEDGHIPADFHDGSSVHDFLKQVSNCASVLNAGTVSRDYREQFTANYRSLLSSRESYSSEILVAGMSQVSGGFLCVNGDMHPLSNECQTSAASLRSALLVLTDNVSRLVNEGCLQENAWSKKPHLRMTFCIFDEAWASFEKVYVNFLIQIEAKSRAPLIEAINLEKEIGRPCGLQHSSCDRFLDCLSNLIAKVQLRHRRTDDVLKHDVLISASKLSHDDRNLVTAVLAKGVVQSFEALRKYLQTVERKIEHAHPDLHQNPELVEKLTAMRQSWKLFEQWGQPGLPNDALNRVVAVAKRAMKLRLSFKNMCEDCDPELFLVLPRILLLCYLDDPTLFLDVCKKFLPGHLGGAEETSPASGKLQVLMHNFCCTTRMLQKAHVKQFSLASETQPDSVFDLLIQRAILGNCYEEHTLYKGFETASRGPVSSKVDSFMLELEGWSVDLQRHTPEVWNDFTALFMACIGDEM